MLLLILIPVAVVWLGVLVLCVSICAIAARGDAGCERMPDETRRPPVRRPTASIPLLRLADASLRLARTRAGSSSSSLRRTPPTLTGRAGR